MKHSLNFAVRKKEIERIQQENYSFAKRLFEKHGDYDRSVMKEEWKLHLKLKKSLKKVEKEQPSPKKNKRKSHT